MSEMNFIPASMAHRQQNDRKLTVGLRSLVLLALGLVAVWALVTAVNRNLEHQVERLNAQREHVNALLQSRDEFAKSLADSQRLAASLDQLNSFSALSAALELLTSSIPAQTELETIEGEFAENGDAVLILEGISDSHKHLTDWLAALKDSPQVVAADIVASDSIQSPDSEQLKQKFSMRISHNSATERAN